MPKAINAITGQVIPIAGEDGIEKLNKIADGEETATSHADIKACMDIGLLTPDNRDALRGPLEIDCGVGTLPLDEVNIQITARPDENSDMLHHTAESIMVQAKSVGAARISLSGGDMSLGDPILHPEFGTIVKHAHKHGMILEAVYVSGRNWDKNLHNLWTHYMSVLPTYTKVILNVSPTLNMMCDLTTLLSTNAVRETIIDTTTISGIDLKTLYDVICNLQPTRWRIYPKDLDIRTLKEPLNAIVDHYQKCRAAHFALEIDGVFHSDRSRDLPTRSHRPGSITATWNGTIIRCPLDLVTYGKVTDIPEAWANVTEGEPR